MILHPLPDRKTIDGTHTFNFPTLTLTAFEHLFWSDDHAFLSRNKLLKTYSEFHEILSICNPHRNSQPQTFRRNRKLLVLYVSVYTSSFHWSFGSLPGLSSQFGHVSIEGRLVV